MIELLIAITVATVAILGALSAESMCAKLNRASHETNRATSDLQSAMERLLLLSIDAIPDPDRGGVAPGTAFADFDGLHLASESIVATYPNYDGAGTVPDPLEIVLTITWEDAAGRERTLSVSSVKTR